MRSQTAPIAMNSANEYYKHHRPEIAGFLPGNYRNVLEIGCGAGLFRANLRSECTYTGVEPSPTAAETARKSLDNVLLGTFDSVAAELPVDHFDLVICNDVIEHMIDHDAFLENIKRHMAPGATLLGSVPNVRYCVHLWHLMVGKDWKHEEHGILDRTHLRFFTLKSWRQTLQAHGYSIDVLQGVTEPNWGTNLVRRWVKLGLANLVGADSKYLQIAFRATRN